MEIIKDIEEYGVSSKIGGNLKNKKLEELTEAGFSEYELRKILAEKVEGILENSIEDVSKRLKLLNGYYGGLDSFTKASLDDYFDTIDKKELETELELEIGALQSILEDYNLGKPITVNDLKFYNTNKDFSEEENYPMYPKINAVSSVLLWPSFYLAIGSLPLLPFHLFGFDTPMKGINNVLSFTIGTAFGLKFLTKASKQSRKIKKNYLKIAHNSAAGLGGLVIASSSLPYAATFVGADMPLTALSTVFIFTLYYKIFKMFTRRESIKDSLPDFNEIEDDLLKQIKKYKEVKSKYKNKDFRKVKKEDFNDEIKFINKYLKHHLTKINLSDIDIEIDPIIDKFIGATARADIISDTSEFSLKKVNGMDANEFALVYAHEISHLDGVINEGRANYRADLVLEDLDIYNPNQGYDLQLEKGKLISVGHAYLLSGELNKKSREDLLKNLFYHGMDYYGMDEKIINSILRWTDPGTGRKSLLRLQQIVGGSNPNGGYTIDHYKLLKKNNKI